MTAAETLDEISSRIAKAAALAGRDPADVTLIAISKTYPAAVIRSFLDIGHRVFGENRVAEAGDKWPELRSAFSGTELHLVGQLQSNKADGAVTMFDAIHSLDRPSLVAALAKAMERTGRRVPCFIQVNIGCEAQKGGCAIEALPQLILETKAAEIPLAGLMCIPPEGKEAAPYFALLAKLAARHQLTGLSMGMSGDFETAIALGATHIRLGSLLFGARESAIEG